MFSVRVGGVLERWIAQGVDYELVNDNNDTWAINTFFVFGLLMALIVIHILVLSYVEAVWLARVRVPGGIWLFFPAYSVSLVTSRPREGRAMSCYLRPVECLRAVP